MGVSGGMGRGEVALARREAEVDRENLLDVGGTPRFR
jgi:hypothetical protein